MHKKLSLLLFLLIGPQPNNGNWKLFAGTAIAASAITGLTWHHFKSKKDTRTIYNEDQLQKFSNDLNAGKKIALVSDLHEVVLKRLSGDLQRARNLTFPEFTKFLGGIFQFGPCYLSYKAFGSTHPAIENFVLTGISDKTHKEHVLQLICPFELDEDMHDQYKNHLPFPKFACSNSGEESYNWLNDKSNGKLDELFLDKQIATQKNGFLQKDREETFDELLKKMQAAGVNPKAILMVDDKAKNIKKCAETFKKHGITVYGYIFKTTDEFKADMKKHGISS